MTWSYGGNPATSSVDAVRLLVGDTNTADQQIQNEEIQFCLTQADNEVYEASAIACRIIAAKYSRLVDTMIDQTGIEVNYSQRQKHYMSLAGSLEKQAKKYGTANLGVPDAGGLTRSEVDAVQSDSDRVPSMFVIDELRNTRNDQCPD